MAGRVAGDETLTSSDLDAGMCEGGTERSRGSSRHLRQLPLAKFLSQRLDRKRECAQKGRKGPLASKGTYFSSSYSHSQGLLEGKKKGEVMFAFQALKID